MSDTLAVNFYEFGKFRLDADRRILFDRDNALVDVTPKALEILCVLVESGGLVVSKDELIQRVWADSFVEEANLSHHIFRLRRALGESDGEKYIETVSKRGYRFVAAIRPTGLNENLDLNSGPTTSVKPKSPSLLNKYLLAASAIIGLLVISTGVYFVWNATRPAPELRPADPTVKSQPSMTISRVTNLGSVGASSISPDGKFVAYVEHSGLGQGMIHVRQTDTNSEIQFLEPGERAFGSTAFSTDSRSIFYVVIDKRDPKGSLYRISVLGGRPEKVLDDIDYFFTLSSDGRYAAFYRANKELKQTSIIIASLDGGSPERTIRTFDTEKESPDSVPAFSPDGKRLAFGYADEPNAVDNAPSRISLFTVEISSGEIKKLSDEKWMGIGMMNWMPDGSGLVFITYREGARNQIRLLSYPKGEVTAITNDLAGYSNYGIGITGDGTTLVADTFEFSSQLWSIGANGKTRSAVQLTTNTLDGGRGLTSLPGGEIVYTSGTGTGLAEDLWKLTDVNGRREGNPLVSDQYSQREPVASPDGTYVVFGSDRAGKRHIFRVDIDGANLKQLTFGDSDDSAPDISPDGKWIIYTSSANDKTRIWKIPSFGGPAVEYTGEESNSPAFSPDGKHISYISPTDSPAKLGRLMVVSSDDGSTEQSFEVVPYDSYYVTPRWTPDGKSLIFRRTDTVVGNLWKQDLVGGQPTQFTDFTSQRIYYFAYSRDSKNLFVSRGSILFNVVMLKNFRPSPRQ
ncbi:hypothetical protein BH10ACI2_BH10ACI2_02800 [soil metagenome]